MNRVLLDLNIQAKGQFCGSVAPATNFNASPVSTLLNSKTTFHLNKHNLANGFGHFSYNIL
jgi:hypothetical protein